MQPFSSNSGQDNETQAMLAGPGNWLPLLGSGDGAEFFFYAHDLQWVLRYLSESAWAVCKIRAEDWLNKSLHPIFTDHQWNQTLVRPDSELEPGRVHRWKVEVLDFAGSPIKLEVWRRLILQNEKPIGVVGMARQFPPSQFSHSESLLGKASPAEIRRRMATLTSREFQVIELVVQGELNKSIAKKLDIAMRTVEARRSKAMTKLGTQRLTDLIRYWILVNEFADGGSET
jgi:DNA-binding CsgD family transcriptional regulator